MILHASPACTPTSLKSRSLMLALSTALMLTSGTVFAQDTGKAAYDAYVKGLEELGLRIEDGAVSYDADNDTLTISDSKITLRGTIQDILREEMNVTDNDGPQQIDPSKLTDAAYSVSLTSDTLTIKGLTHEASSFSANTWTYSDDTKINLNVALIGESRVRIEGRLSGAHIDNYRFFLPQLPPADPSHEVSRWLPFVKKALLTSYDEAVVDSTALTIETFQNVGGPNGGETLFASGTSLVNGYRAAGVESGMIAELSFGSLTQATRSLEPASGQMLLQETTQGKTLYTNIDAGALLDLFDPEIPESEQETIVIGSGSAVDYSSRQDLGHGISVEVTVDHSSLNELTIAKQKNNLLSLFDKLLARTAPAPEEIITVLFQVYRSFGITDAHISGVKLKVPTPGQQNIVDVSIEELGMTDVNSKGIGKIMLVGVDAPTLPDGVSIKLDRAAIGDIEFADYVPMRAMISTLMADPSFGEDHPLDIVRAFMPLSLGYEVKGLDIVTRDKEQVKIAAAEMTASTTVSPIPTNVFLRNEGIQMPIRAIDAPGAEALFQTLGLENVVWSDETRLNWDEATLELHLEKIMVEIEGLGRAELSARFANVPKSLFEDPESQVQMALIAAQFVEASATFHDAGLASKGVAHFAEIQGIPENVFREALVAQAAEATAPVQNEAFTKMVSDAVSKFLGNPGDLTITLTPQGPVPLAQILGSMAAPQTLPDLLNVKVEAN